jgi:D-alanyl-lipoteichoic acid acyltransferase DltB (MBOAT superfamily)
MAFVPVYILILAFTIVIDYFAGIAIAGSEGRNRKWWLVGSLVANIGVLAFFKYFNFLNSNVEALAQFLGWNYPIGYLKIILPIGLSFHTFQAMSYTIEVYRRKQAPERHFGIYALYVMFYPQLVAGPIERPQNLLHQFRERHGFDYQNVTDGLKLMLWGMFKKMVIADRFAPLVNTVYDKPEAYHGMSLIIGTLLFAVQIYADFSAYSDIAIGSARVMGFKLIPNFDRPYFAKDIQDFWHRWHMSLSYWFRDYLFLPVAYAVNRRWKKEYYFGLRTDKWVYIYATSITMLLCGLWHGANWTFVVWGGLHAFYMVVWFLFKKKKKKKPVTLLQKLYKPVQRILHSVGVILLASFAWIFFRAETMADAWKIIMNIFTTHSQWWSLTFIPKMADFRLSLAFLLLMLLVEYFQKSKDIPAFVSSASWWLRWPVYIVFFWFIMIYGNFGNQHFIYFQF